MRFLTSILSFCVAAMLIASPAAAEKKIVKDNLGRKVVVDVPSGEKPTAANVLGTASAFGTEGVTYILPTDEVDYQWEPHFFDLRLGPGFIAASDNDATNDGMKVELGLYWHANSWLQIAADVYSESNEWSIINIAPSLKTYIFPQPFTSIKPYGKLRLFNVGIDADENDPAEGYFRFAPTLFGGVEFPQRGYSLFVEGGIGYVFSQDGASVNEGAPAEGELGINLWWGR